MEEEPGHSVQRLLLSKSCRQATAACRMGSSTTYRSVRLDVGVKCGVRGSFVGRSFPHDRSGPDGEQPRYTHSHARGDCPTQRLHPRCPSVGRHWGLRGVAQSLPRCLKCSMGEQPGQSASTVACCPPAEFPLLHCGEIPESSRRQTTPIRLGTSSSPFRLIRHTSGITGMDDLSLSRTDSTT